MFSVKVWLDHIFIAPGNMLDIHIPLPVNIPFNIACDMIQSCYYAALKFTIVTAIFFPL